jgi:hypothetical protein
LYSLLRHTSLLFLVRNKKTKHFCFVFLLQHVWILHLKINNYLSKLTESLIVFSSAFFAHERLGFSDKIIYSILDKVIPSVYTYKEGEINNLIDSCEYILTDEYANKLINLLDGTKLSFKDYLVKNNILENIKNDYVLHMKSGEVISGKQFLDSLYKYVSNYNTFKELFDDMVYMMEYK